MSILSKYNKGNKFDFKSPKESEWVKLADLVKQDGTGAIYPLKALYINTKGEYGDEPILVTDKFLVNAPSHLVGTVRDMINDDDVVKYINDDHVSFTIYKYEGKRGVGYSVRWIDNEDK